MHGEWLENPAVSIVLFCIAFYLLYRALRMKKQHRYHQHSDHNDVQRVILGHNVIDTSTGWLLFTGFIALTAIGAHFLAEYTFHLYDTTPIDKFTHGLSGMAITALILNFY
jgi:Ca2+/Na+ antiporter